MGKQIPTGGRQSSWLFAFTSVAKDLNSGPPRTNPASGQARVARSMVSANQR